MRVLSDFLPYKALSMENPCLAKDMTQVIKMWPQITLFLASVISAARLKPLRLTENLIRWKKTDRVAKKGFHSPVPFDGEGAEGVLVFE